MEGQTKIVSSKELGTRCWSTARFIEGKRCSRVMGCQYPEKKTCKAVDAEIAHQHQRRRGIAEKTHSKITKLIAERQGVK